MNSRQRRVYRRGLERRNIPVPAYLFPVAPAGQAAVKDPFAVGVEVRIVTAAYGVSYKKTLATVVSVQPLRVKSKKRKSPIDITDPAHIVLKEVA